MDASIAQQIADARDLAACGQPTSALVYFEALIPQLSKCVAQQLMLYAATQRLYCIGLHRRVLSSVV
jgi:hypothetical protein